ncbi:MarR family transcriptional regulator [Butyrivibrio sp. AC2005]|uniref:MarR family transcriptional regulator n=1 Tax=Butyrivibrio sp. AC2005 TaxID=1280672 RepID=UPI0012DF4C9D|nr:helix-turn-helix domain-containing protein [Butyrivibrio sp. AC2005]
MRTNRKKKTPNKCEESLAKVRGITKGAVSQMVNKLVDRDLMEKRVSPDSDAAICLYLTKKVKRQGMITARCMKTWELCMKLCLTKYLKVLWIA